MGTQELELAGTPPVRGRLVVDDDQLVPVVRVHGEVDVSNAGDLELHLATVLLDCALERRTAVIDLTEVRFFGAAGFGALTAVNLWCTPGRPLRLVATDRLARLIRVVGLAAQLPLFESVSAALAG